MLDIKITKTTEPKAKPQAGQKLGFGKIFTDHMFVMNYTEGKGWHDARIEPFHNISLSPAAKPEIVTTDEASCTIVAVQLRQKHLPVHPHHRFIHRISPDGLDPVPAQKPDPILAGGQQRRGIRTEQRLGVGFKGDGSGAVSILPGQPGAGMQQHLMAPVDPVKKAQGKYPSFVVHAWASFYSFMPDIPSVGRGHDPADQVG